MDKQVKRIAEELTKIRKMKEKELGKTVCNIHINTSSDADMQVVRRELKGIFSDEATDDVGECLVKGFATGYIDPVRLDPGKCGEFKHLISTVQELEEDGLIDSKTRNEVENKVKEKLDRKRH